MKRSTRAVVMMALGGLLAVAANAAAQDWPQWRGPNRDGKTTGFDAPAEWPAELTKKWDIVVGNGVANPSLAGDRLYVITREGENEVVRCMNAMTGEEIWKDSYASAAATGYGRGPNGMFEGARSTPTIADGRVITLGVNGMLSCYDAASGAVKWRKDEFVGQVPEFFTSSSPLVVDGLCIAQLGARGGEGARIDDKQLGAMIAYDLETGEEKWRAADASPAYASPMSMNVDGMKVIVALSESQLVAVDASNGNVVWKIPMRQGRYNSSSPVIDDQTLLIAGPGTRGITALKMTKQGEALQEVEAWTYDDNQLIFNTPVLKDGAIYGYSTRDQVFSVDAEHQTGWTAPIAPPDTATGQLNPQGGQTVFAQAQRRGRGRQRPGGGGERPGYGSVVDAGSVLVALCPAAHLVIIAPNAETYTELARYKVSEDGDCYSHPILSGNRIYIKDRDSLAMYTVE